jgi:hypothetical protein
VSQTKKIESLTPAQIAKFSEYVQRWTDIGLSTLPADRGAAESAIADMYRAGGLVPPKKIVWCGSPLSQGLTRAIILDRKLLADIGKEVGASVWASVGASVRASVRDSVVASVRASVGASVRASVRDSVGASVWDSVWDSVWASVGDSVGASVWASVGASVGASVWASVRDSVGASVCGQHDAAWLAFYKFFHDEVGLTKQTEKLSGLWMLSKSAGWAIPHENICWVSERHNILERDAQGRLHSISGPACAYPDGWGIYAVHGVRVPADIIEDRSSITVTRIANETNSEIRRVMIDLYGAKRYLTDSGAKVIQRLPDDHYIVGLRSAQLLMQDVPDDEPIVMIDLLNSTPEPDGTTKRYLLRVDPNAYDGEASRDCLAAVASTWRMPDGSLAFKRPQDYAPVFES